MALPFPFQPIDLILFFAGLSISGSTLNVEFIQPRQGTFLSYLTRCSMSSAWQARTAVSLLGTQKKGMDPVASHWSPHNPGVDA